MVRRHPDYVHAQVRLSDVLRGLHRLDEALRVIRSACERRPFDPSCKLQLGDLLLSAGDLAGAERALRGVLALHPHNAAASRRRAATLEELGRVEEALLAARKATDLRPYDAELRRCLDDLRSRIEAPEAVESGP